MSHKFSSNKVGDVAYTCQLFENLIPTCKDLVESMLKDLKLSSLHVEKQKTHTAAF